VLDFKLINSEGTLSNTDFVPVAASLGDGVYDFNIKYIQNQYNNNIMQYPFASSRATHNLMYDGSSAGVHENILHSSEDLTSWSITGTTSSGEQILENSTEVESVLYEVGALKIGTELDAADGSMGIEQTFSIEANTKFIYSVYVSYEEIEDYSSSAGPVSTIHMGNSVLYIYWDTENEGDISFIAAGGGGNVSKESFRIGTRKWHRVSWLYNATSATSYTARIHPSGPGSTAKGYAYFCHPQVSITHKIQPYYPNYNNSSGTHDPVIPELVGGPVDQNMTALVEDGYVIYDAVTNKVFNKYVKGNAKVFLSAEDYATRKLLIKSYSGISILKAHPRFPTILESTSFYCPTLDAATLSIQIHPADRFKVYVSDKEETKAWRLRFKKGFNITKKRIVNVNGGTERDTMYWNERPEFLTPTLVKVAEQGLTQFTFDVETDVVEDTTENYTLLGENLDVSIMANYDAEIEGIDAQRGLILFKYPPPGDIRLTYQTNDKWGTFDLELNPKISAEVKELEVKSGSNGELLLEVNNKGVLSHNGEDELIELLEVFDNYVTVAQLSILNIKPTLVDLVQKGGSVLDTENQDLDIRSHTKYGYVGVDPTELNIIIVTIPDKALAELLYQFNIIDGFELIEDPREEQWDTATRLDRISLLQLGEEFPTASAALTELLSSIKQHTATGMPIIVEDIDNNIIYSD